MASQPNQRHLQTALYHAKIIQHRKDAEMKIFESLEKLLEYPLTENATPEAPSESDVEEVTKLLQLFRPSDFEDLMDERRMADRCGYPLCPREPRKQTGGGRLRVVQKKNDIQVLPKEKLETWCSPTCARRCVYLIAQFSQEPAWTRQESKIPALDFLVGDPKEGTTRSWIQTSSNTESSELESISQGVAKLAFRPKPGANNLIDQYSMIMRDEVVEKPTVKAPREPQPDSDDDTGHDAVEGFKPGGKVDIDRKGVFSLIG